MNRQSPIDDDTVAALFEAAAGAREFAHAPYSRFHVGAAALSLDGSIHIGCNVENAAYPAGLCAEAGAISAMVASGRSDLAAVLVIGGGPALCTPCGSCRQRMREFSSGDALVLVAGPEGVRRRFTLAELLPEGFGPETLGSSR